LLQIYFTDILIQGFALPRNLITRLSVFQRKFDFKWDNTPMG